MHIDNNYLVLDDNDIIQDKKIKGHSFVELLGMNRFKKTGDALLTQCGLLPTDEIDKKWLLRGDFAEKLVKLTYEKKGRKCTTYNKKIIKYDNFHDNKDFGGLIDIELLEEKTLIEVKSKSIKDFDFITKRQPDSEINQGMLYAFLRGYADFIMEWIFFDEITEAEICAGLKPANLSNLKRISKVYKVDYELMIGYMDICLEKIDDFKKNRKIHLQYISDEALDKLGLLNKNINIDDLGWLDD